MSFPRVNEKLGGYEVAAVDKFLDLIRNDSSVSPSVGFIRSAAFPIVKGGYATRSVDEKLDELEDEALDAERVLLIRELGFEAANLSNREIAQTILNRVSRAKEHKFQRVTPFTYGYNMSQVDAFTARISEYFTAAVPLSRAEVRRATFDPQLGGYDERQVDMLFDELVRVLYAVR